MKRLALFFSFLFVCTGAVAMEVETIEQDVMILNKKCIGLIGVKEIIKNVKINGKIKSSNRFYFHVAYLSPKHPVLSDSFGKRYPFFGDEKLGKRIYGEITRRMKQHIREQS